MKENKTRTKKQRLQEQCKHMLTSPYSEGGIGSDSEFNQFLCDIAPELVNYMSVEGLIWLKERMDNVYNNMSEFDKW